MIKNEKIELGQEVSLEIPPEPPVRSVVTDRNGRAWQRLPERMFTPSKWYCAGPLFATPFTEYVPDSLHWENLLVHRAPLTLIYTPDEVTE